MLIVRSGWNYKNKWNVIVVYIHINKYTFAFSEWLALLRMVYIDKIDEYEEVYDEYGTGTTEFIYYDAG